MLRWFLMQKRYIIGGNNMRIPIVDEQDEIIKIIDINDGQKGEICRVSALWIINEKGEVLLAQRSLRKRRDPMNILVNGLALWLIASIIL